MKKRYALFTPGEFIATHVYRNYTKFSPRVDREIKRGNRKLFWLSTPLPLFERALFVIFGLLTGHLGLTWFPLALILLYPIIAFGDLLLWHRLYGWAVKGFGCRLALLLNLDALYWSTIGWIIGLLIL